MNMIDKIIVDELLNPPYERIALALAKNNISTEHFDGGQTILPKKEKREVLDYLKNFNRRKWWLDTWG